MNLIESIAAHPWIAAALGAWLLVVITLVLNALKECVAVLVTRKRPPQPDFRALTQARSMLDESQPRTKRGPRRVTPKDRRPENPES
jgi:hypothetical protein